MAPKLVVFKSRAIRKTVSKFNSEDETHASDFVKAAFSQYFGEEKMQATAFELFEFWQKSGLDARHAPVSL